MNTGLDQYMDIFKDAVEDSAAKLTKSFEKILIEVIILFMVIPRKINFTQMGRYGSHVEQTYRNAFGLKKSKSIDWLKLNVSLAKRFFGKQGRWAIAIDPSYISKAGKKTPHIGRFWSGCAQSVKHGRKHPTPMTIQLHPQCLLGIQGILRNWTFLIFKQV